MEHTYKNVFGYFNFEDIYSEVVDKFPDGSHFVEIGSFFGRSSIYMAVEIIRSKKNIKLDNVDKWDFGWNLNGEKVDVETEYLKNIEPYRHIINPVKGDSSKIASEYEDESLDFVFIDGDHNYDGCKKDIVNWYPKVKKGGIIAGHDYVPDFQGVVDAVDEFFGKDSIEQRNCSWVVNKI